MTYMIRRVKMLTSTGSMDSIVQKQGLTGQKITNESFGMIKFVDP